MPKALRVGVDVDGVLADMAGAFLGVLNEMRRPDEPYQLSDITEHDLGRAFGLDQRLLEAVWAGVRIAELRVLEEGKRLYRGLCEQGHNVIAVTSPSTHIPGWVADREAWLQRELGLPRSQVVHCKNKTHARVDVLIDDLPDNCELFAREVGLALLWDAPWNLLQPCTVKRVRCAEEVLRYLECVQSHSH